MHCLANNQNWQIMQDGPAYNQCVVLSKQTFVNLLTYFPVILVKKHTYTTLSWVILVWPVDSLTLHLFLFTRQAKTCQVILKKKHGSTRSSLDVSSAEFCKAPTSQSRADNDETVQRVTDRPCRRRRCPAVCAAPPGVAARVPALRRRRGTVAGSGAADPARRRSRRTTTHCCPPAVRKQLNPSRTQSHWRIFNATYISRQ